MPLFAVFLGMLNWDDTSIKPGPSGETTGNTLESFIMSWKERYLGFPGELVTPVT